MTMASTPDRVIAPFSPDQIASLNGFQQAYVWHPFTCGTDGCGHDLKATASGWICPACAYTQDWAWPFMADGSWRVYLEMRQQILPETTL